MLHDLLIEELNHRVKNTLAVLQSIATQTFRSASRAEREKFEGRLGALAEAHNLLSQEKWQGAELREVIARVLQPYLLNNPERMRMFGPQVPLSPRLAVVLSMIVHEIATNAAKYGALSNDTGTVALDWEILEESDGRKLRLIWTEAGGPPVTAPVQRGFGSRLIERSARDQLGGEATVDFLPPRRRLHGELRARQGGIGRYGDRYFSISGTIRRGRNSETSGQMISAASTSSIGTSMMAVSFSA